DALEVRAGDMPANHTVIPLLAGMSRSDVLELPDIADADRDAELDPPGVWPIRPLHRTQRIVDAVTQHDDQIIHPVAQGGQPGSARNNPVELVAMQDQQALAARGPVDPL